MVYTCFSCKWRSDKVPRRSYHKFPSNEELKQKWLDLLGKSDVSIGKRTTLCCLHFEEDCFRYGLVNGMKILKNGSLPTLHLINTEKQNPPIESILEIVLSERSMESRTDNEHTNDKTSVYIEDSQAKPSSSVMDDRKIVVEVPPMVSSLDLSSSKKSSPIVDQPGKDEVVEIQKKVVTLKHSIKRLHNSKCQIEAQMAKLKKKVNKYEAKIKILNGRNGLTKVMEFFL